MKRFKYQNYLMVKDITGSVKVMELHRGRTGNLDDPNWLYIPRLGTTEIERFIETSLSYFIPTEFTFEMHTVSDTKVNFLGYDHHKDLIIRFCLDCRDKDMMDEALNEIRNGLKHERLWIMG